MHTITAEPSSLPALGDNLFTALLIGLAVSAVLTVVGVALALFVPKVKNTPTVGIVAALAIFFSPMIAVLGGVLVNAGGIDSWQHQAVTYLSAEYNIHITDQDSYRLARHETIPAVYRGQTITLRVTGDNNQNITRADGTPIRGRH